MVVLLSLGAYLSGVLAIFSLCGSCADLTKTAASFMGAPLCTFAALLQYAIGAATASMELDFSDVPGVKGTKFTVRDINAHKDLGSFDGKWSGSVASHDAAFLVIEDEASAQNIWARKRIKFDAEITEIERKSDNFNAVCDVFAARHGPTMGLIRDFTDFHLLRLRPTGGVMVLGFAQAYRLAGSDLAVTAHLRQS